MAGDVKIGIYPYPGIEENNKAYIQIL